MWFGVFMLLAMAITWFAPDTRWDERLESEEELAKGELAPKVQAIALAVVGTLWGWALLTVIVYMVRSLTAAPADRPDATEFIRFYGPLIVVATVVVPAVLAGVLDGWRRQGRYLASEADRRRRTFLDHAYGSLVEPLSELVGRLRWAAILVLAIVLSYRLTDSIWGPFALPFYLQELGYTNDEVAVASKFFGVGMTMAGITLGAVLFTWLGRMPTVVLGALLAAATNLLYADLAQGGAGLDAFGNATGFYALTEVFGADARLSRLLLAITGENLAGGLAGAAFVAYLSSITAKSHAAVQYALLSSLTVLVGSLGRAALGEEIDTGGYAPVFYLTAGIGMVAVVLCVAEWLRQGRESRAAADTVPSAAAA
jgi:PAT family beta-lactamase induction signal transducer AmpG